MTYTERFAAELRSRRGFLDLSQDELSKRSDVNSRSISQYENETCAPTLESIANLDSRIADAHRFPRRHLLRQPGYPTGRIGSACRARTE